MAFHWFHLFFGVLCIESYLTFSPVPEENFDNEWIKYNELQRDSSYRLPVTTSPSHYEVTLAPFLEIVPTNVPNAQPFTFDGEVAITITATQANVNEIVLHCNDMTISELSVTSSTDTKLNLATDTAFTCHMPWSFLRINLNTALNTDHQYIIKSKFKGRLQNNMQGFYKSWYFDSSGKRRWMATTQFQPGHARQAFPCYDEPGFKARFDITIIREAHFSPTLSNMPIVNNFTLPDSRISETFGTTPFISTYLVAFIVSHHKLVSSGTTPGRLFHIYARDNAGTTGDWALEVGEKLLTAMEEYTQIPYYTMTPNISMQQAAIPDFLAGAMENWGLLTHREVLLLYDPENSNHYYKQRVACTVSHEIVHQWFGNLVTCAWWDNLWLNEGFARFYQYYLTQQIAPQLGYATRFIVEQVHLSLLFDSMKNTHALKNPSVNSPATVSAQFSQITYGKGASVLRMTQHLLGDSTFRKGIIRYLNEYKWSVAEPEDLFSAIDYAAAEDNALDGYGRITIKEYMSTWTEQAGHPLLTVTVNHTTGRMLLIQERFNIDPGLSVPSTNWHIPITWTRAGLLDFSNLKPTMIMTDRTTIIERGTTGKEWVIFNMQQSGFYRVNYDSNTWSLITQGMRTFRDRMLTHESNRAQIVDDVFNLARAGILSYNKAFNILSFLEFEITYAPWIAAIVGFNFSRRRLAHSDAALKELEALIHKLSEEVSNRLGFVEIPNESFMNGFLRMHLNTFLCNTGHPLCINAGRLNFANWKNSNTFIPANMRPWVYCTGLRYGTAEDFDFFWDRYLVEDLAGEKVVMLTAAGCTSDEGSLRKYLNAITAGKNDFSIRDQDQYAAIYSALTSNERNMLIAFEWLKDNVERTRRALGSPYFILSIITSRLLNEEQIAEVSGWLEENRATIGNAAYNVAISGIATSRANIDWYNRRLPEYESYFKTGYIEDSLEEYVDSDSDDDDNDDGADGDNDDNDNGPSSPPPSTITVLTRSAASITTFSILTLFFSIVFNPV